MSSGKQKRKEIQQRRQEKRTTAADGTLKKGNAVTVDPTKIKSRSVLPRIPDYYYDLEFTCKDCGKQEVWTAKMQQRWYEVQGGEIESTAVRCNACRTLEKARVAEARRVHFNGLKKSGKLDRGADAKDLPSSEP